MDLLERDGALEAVGEARRRGVAGAGRVVLVAGEAGIGKSSLLTAVPVAHGASRRFLVGACDPLLTPRALGPFHDIARQAGGRLADALRGDGGREDLVAALLDEIDESPPRVLVVEDVHWADEGTLDLLALLGRRIGTTTATLMVTLRPDQAGDRLRATLGELPAGWCDASTSSPSARGPWRSWPAGPAARRPTSTGPPGATPSTSPRCWPRRATRCPARCATRCGPGAPAVARRAGGARDRRRRPRARRDVARRAVLEGDPAGPVDECVAAGMLRARRGRPALPPRDRPLQRGGGAVADAPPRARRARPRRPPRARRRQPGAPGAPRTARGRPGGRPRRHPRRRRRRGRRGRARPGGRALPRGARRRGGRALGAAGRAAGGPLGAGLPLRGPDEALATRREALAIRTTSARSPSARIERWLSRLLWWAGRRVESEAAANRAVALLEPLGPARASPWRTAPCPS